MLEKQQRKVSLLFNWFRCPLGFTVTTMTQKSRPQLLMVSPAKEQFAQSLNIPAWLEQLIYRHGFFPDGERQFQIEDSKIDGADLYLIGSAETPQDFLDLFFLMDGIIRKRCHKLTVLIPFMGYSTAERAGKPGEVPALKTLLTIFSNFPAPSGTQIVLFDLHVESSRYFLERGTQSRNLSSDEILLSGIRERILGKGEGDFCIGSIDAGGVERVERFSNALDLPFLVGLKKRNAESQSEVIEVVGEYTGKTVIFVDDMVRTGGSALGIARYIMQHGAAAVWLVATHGVFPGKALAGLQDSGLFSGVLVTNSHNRTLELASEDRFQSFLHVIPVEDILVRAFKEPPV